MAAILFSHVRKEAATQQYTQELDGTASAAIEPHTVCEIHWSDEQKRFKKWFLAYDIVQVPTFVSKLSALIVRAT